jgi:hypothetical protein
MQLFNELFISDKDMNFMPAMIMRPNQIKNNAIH